MVAKLISQVKKNLQKINTKIHHPIFMNNLVNTIDHIKKEKKTKIKKRGTRGKSQGTC